LKSGYQGKKFGKRKRDGKDGDGIRLEPCDYPTAGDGGNGDTGRDYGDDVNGKGDGDETGKQNQDKQENLFHWKPLFYLSV
jgi:hypothetical protein